MALRRMLLVGLALFTLACNSDNDQPKKDLPPGWEGALDLPLVQLECGGDLTAPAHELVLMRQSGGVRATFRDVAVRCNQPQCGFRLDPTGATRVLVQPCEMNPQGVNKCACRQDLSFDLPGVTAGSTVEFHHRGDRYGATAEPLPMLLDSERAP